MLCSCVLSELELECALGILAIMAKCANVKTECASPQSITRSSSHLSGIRVNRKQMYGDLRSERHALGATTRVY